MKKLLNALPLLIAFALLTYGGWQHDRSRPLGELWQVAQCHDGDTCTLTRGTERLKVRFACTDAPELKQEQGIASRDYLRALLASANNQVKVKAVARDRYGRTVAELYLNAGGEWELVQMAQVQAGWVWANEKYQSDCPHWDEIAKAESQARAQRRGIWAGQPVPPWQWRSAGNL
jgi:endonuclease YncB( thermonuclease family)